LLLNALASTLVPARGDEAKFFQFSGFSSSVTKNIPKIPYSKPIAFDLSTFSAFT
jgi:hypothetical protein